MYKIFKFGGASVKDAEGVRNLKKILDLYQNEKLIVVISAMGKTTNLMEKLLDAWYFGKTNWEEHCETFEKYHLEIAEKLETSKGEIAEFLYPIFAQLRNILTKPHHNYYDKDYDDIVSFGEYVSTKLISKYLQLNGVDCVFSCTINLVKTDDSYREAKVVWEATEKAIKEFVAKNPNKTIITQGFMGGDKDGNVTTLGREGSDYSAAIFAYCLDAKDVTIWKDVPGLLNADPKHYPDAVKLDEISYQEAIELAYYGATVIHPKTIKPLQNKNIPLYVKSFLNPLDEGTIIANINSKVNTPSYIFKSEQVLLTIFPKDYSFMGAENLTKIFALLSKHKLKINMMQNSALSFTICLDDKPNRFANFLNDLENEFVSKYNTGAKLITIRHYTPEALEKVLANETIILEQRSRTTLQVIVN